MNVILALDTASPAMALAVRDPAGAVRTLVRECGHDHSRLLVPVIEEILGDSKRSLAGLVAVCGPGSYAGIRVGLATARALALARGLPLAGVTTFEAIGALCGPGRWLAVHPVGRGTFAAQRIVDGEPVGGLSSETAESLRATGEQLGGEGAGALGGREIGPRGARRGSPAGGPRPSRGSYGRCRGRLPARTEYHPTAAAGGCRATNLMEEDRWNAP